MKRLPIFLAIALLSGCSLFDPTVYFPPTPPAVTPVVSNAAGITNLVLVDKDHNIWRGSQFDEAGLAYLKTLGIKRILKLNTREESTADDLAVNQGLEVRFAPISRMQQLGLEPIPRDQIISNIAFMKRGDCFVHCEHGQDRTGLQCYCYERSVMGHDPLSAKETMDALGFHHILHGLSEFVENFKP